jgi:hypothetical protein
MGTYVCKERWLRVELRRILCGELLVLHDLASIEDLQDLCQPLRPNQHIKVWQPHN